MSETKAARPRRLIERGQRAAAAMLHLSGADARLRAIIERVGPHRPIITRDPFVTLVGSIVQQQISMSAAAAIQKRLRDLCPERRVSPEALLGVRRDRLRKAGLSGMKADYIRDLSAHFAEGVLTSRKLRRMSDEEVIEATTQVKGIGRWTAEMLLIFCLERPDVWPIDDLGLRKAARNYLGLADFPDKKTITGMGEPLRPFRSYASWYLWRSLEGPMMPGISL